MKTVKITIISCIFILAILLCIFAVQKPKTVQTANKSATYHILVDVEDSKMYILQDGVCVKTYKCSGGKYSTPSPIGTWTIVQKSLWGEGFGGRWLGFNVPWGQFGIHGTTEPNSVGWASSHGCIRMNNSDVAELYSYIPYGTKVTIIDGPYGNFGKGLRYLKSGMYGSDVMEIQKRLADLGFFTGNTNGKFGSETEAAVQRYCKANGLYVRKTIDIDLQKHMGFILAD